MLGNIMPVLETVRSSVEAILQGSGKIRSRSNGSATKHLTRTTAAESSLQEICLEHSKATSGPECNVTVSTFSGSSTKSTSLPPYVGVSDYEYRLQPEVGDRIFVFIINS